MNYFQLTNILLLKVEADYNRIGDTFKYNLARDAFKNIANMIIILISYFNKDM